MSVNANAVSGDHFCCLELPSAIYAIDAVKRAAYRFCDRIAVEITLDGPAIKCRLIAVTPLASKNLDQITNDFRIEVLDQDLRLKIASETEPLRNLILSLAFSKTGLQG